MEKLKSLLIFVKALASFAFTFATVAFLLLLWATAIAWGTSLCLGYWAGLLS